MIVCSPLHIDTIQKWCCLLHLQLDTGVKALRNVVWGGVTSEKCMKLLTHINVVKALLRRRTQAHTVYASTRKAVSPKSNAARLHAKRKLGHDPFPQGLTLKSYNPKS